MLAVLTVALSFPSAVLAEEKYQPSLYLADNVWYKDKSQPLVIKSSNSFYVPAEAFDILPDVTLTKNEELGAILLASPKTSISIDTNNGTVILPNEDKTISVITENGNLQAKTQQAVPLCLFAMVHPPAFRLVFCFGAL